MFDKTLSVNVDWETYRLMREAMRRKRKITHAKFGNSTFIRECIIDYLKRNQD